MSNSIVGTHHSFRGLSTAAFSINERQRFCSVTAIIAFALLALGACHRETHASFVQSLRCGMTRADVARLAKQSGYNSSDASWLARSAGNPSTRSKPLSLIDLTFREGRLVAVREGAWDPRAKRVIYRTRNLCGG